ncbi:phosphoribosyltransferase [Trinickia dinghuensis]|uniref:Phosphoribosyltransferase n=1 Tax=Trinickia dinghuensis TaxID=2291023 RepID=A0A3D8JS09_9BURK|nr:phosphoribosyltransferase family protein [Trinickia dinghuensis]RDU95466.1 phosphoribosyltransferase [Trinickia dinghuensis]
MHKPILALTYDRIDQWIASLQPDLAAEGFACAVGILRGGGPLALMVSHAVGVPAAFLRYERATRAVAWDSSIPLPPPGSKVLVCEDIAGAGNTLDDCVAFLRGHGLEVKTLVAAFDDLSRMRPDYGIDARGYFVLFPWERHAYTDGYREAWQRTRAGMDGAIGEDHEFAVYAIDLDGILLPDVAPQHYEADLAAALAERDALLPFERLPGIDFTRVKAIVTGRPEMDRPRTLDWLARHGFHGPSLVMRDTARYGDRPHEVAAHKARAAVALSCTHFVESDPVQSIHIAQFAPLMRVVWWDAFQGAGQLVSAHRWETAAGGPMLARPQALPAA